MEKTMEKIVALAKNRGFVYSVSSLGVTGARSEIKTDLASIVEEMCIRDRVETDMELFEIVGTGGDNAHSFNISTTSALVAAAGGMKVAK